jgi:glycerate kinase
VVGQPAPPTELDFTVFDPDRLQFRARIEEKDLHLIGAGLAGRVEPPGYPEADVPVTLAPLVPVPREGAIDAVFAVADRPMDLGTSIENGEVLLMRSAEQVARLIASVWARA